MDEKAKALEMFLKREAKTASGRFVISAMEHMKKEKAPERLRRGNTTSEKRLPKLPDRKIM